MSEDTLDCWNLLEQYRIRMMIVITPAEYEYATQDDNEPTANRVGAACEGDHYCSN